MSKIVIVMIKLRFCEPYSEVLIDLNLSHKFPISNSLKQ
jgi:hypothetical protein